MARIINIITLISITCIWLVPNKYKPWVSFHNEVMVGLSLIFIYFKYLVYEKTKFNLINRYIYKFDALFFLVFIISVVQLNLGLVSFVGEIYVLLLYACGVIFSYRLGRVESSNRRVIELFFGSIVCSAIISVGLQLYQWLGLSGLGLFVADLPMGGRPFGNLGQPNQLATLIFFGIIGSYVLYEAGHIEKSCHFILVNFLMCGCVMTGSRSSWLQILFFISWLLIYKKKYDLGVSRSYIILNLMSYISLFLLWPVINELIILEPGRTLENQLNLGTRWLHWEVLIHAIQMEPWFGYGWSQVAKAQIYSAAFYPSSGEWLEYSHNLFIDLFVWFGIPVGLLLSIILILWWRRLMCVTCEKFKGLILMAIGGFFIHALVEFPHAYAYFLMPVAFMMGLIDASSQIIKNRNWICVFNNIINIISITLFIAISSIYISAEEKFRQLRFSLAKIGQVDYAYESGSIFLINQLDNLLAFLSVGVEDLIISKGIYWMREVRNRYPTELVNQKFIKALELAGRHQEAEEARKLSCKIHYVDGCVYYD